MTRNAKPGRKNVFPTMEEKEEKDKQEKQCFLCDKNTSFGQQSASTSAAFLDGTQTSKVVSVSSNIHEIRTNKLGLSCAKLRIVELKIEDNKMLGLNENWDEKHKR